MIFQNQFVAVFIYDIKMRLEMISLGVFSDFSVSFELQPAATAEAIFDDIIDI